VPDYDPETGETVDSAEIRALRAELKVVKDERDGFEKAFKSANAAYRELKRDKEKSARQHSLWAVAERLFGLWLVATGKQAPTGEKLIKGKLPVFTWERFELVKARLKDSSASMVEEQGPPANDFECCAAAIVGRVDDHFIGQRANGSKVHYYEFERIFDKPRDFDESMSRRPKDWRARFEAWDPGERSVGPRST
jgi:hypothetical protein